MPTLCPPGTYTLDDDGSADAARPLVNENACKSCVANYFCPDYGITDVLGDDPYTGHACPAGYICYSGAIHPSDRDDITIKFCPAGSFCNILIGDLAEQ